MLLLCVFILVFLRLVVGVQCCVFSMLCVFHVVCFQNGVCFQCCVFILLVLFVLVVLMFVFYHTHCVFMLLVLFILVCTFLTRFVSISFTSLFVHSLGSRVESVDGMLPHAKGTPVPLQTSFLCVVE